MNELLSGDARPFLLILARIAGALLTAPIFGSRPLPLAARGGIALALSLALAPIVPVESPVGIPALVVAAAGDFALGLAMGFAASLFFAAVQMAGSMIDQHLGMAMEEDVDPMGDEPTSTLGRFQLVLAGLVYLLVNGHLLFVSAITDSFRTIPGGRVACGLEGRWETAASMAGQLFVVGLKIAAPALATVLLVTVALGFLARTVPELNPFLIGYPTRFFAALVVMALGVGLLVQAMAREVQGATFLPGLASMVER